MDLLRQIDWQAIASYRDCVLVINKEKPTEYVVLQYRNKEEFSDIEVFVDVDQNSNRVAYYKILQKIMDNSRNLILIAEKKE